MPDLKRRWTAADRDALPDDGNRYEVLDGELFVRPAAEILSPSTARADRVKKRSIYRDEHVPEYGIVDLDSRTFERSTPDEARPEILVDKLEWMPAGASTSLVIDVPAYFTAVLAP